jgi:hypothetical protein
VEQLSGDGGEAEPPAFLEVDWTLSCFGREKTKAREAYRRFVSEGRGTAEPREAVAGRPFLGGAEFLDEMERRIERTSVSPAIPASQRPKPFVELARVSAAVDEAYGLDERELREPWRQGEERAVAVYLALELTGLPGSDIAEGFGVTAARVSQLVKQVEERGDTKLRRRVERLRERLASCEG